jgi:hypothetical protein
MKVVSVGLRHVRRCHYAEFLALNSNIGYSENIYVIKIKICTLVSLYWTEGLHIKTPISVSES